MNRFEKLIFVFVCLYFSPISMAHAEIGIIGAMDSEIAALQIHMSDVVEESRGFLKVTRGRIGKNQVVLTKSGVGKVNVSATLQSLISHYGLKQVIFTGVAGGIDPKNQVGDIVIAEKIALHDYGMMGPDGFVLWRSGSLMLTGTGPKPDVWFDGTHHPLFKKAVDLLSKINLPELPKELSSEQRVPKIKTGRIVTGDIFLANDQKRQQLQIQLQADAVEMEGAAFMQVCELNQLDCLVVRSISDLADGKSKLDFPKFAAYASQNSALVVKTLLSD